MRYFWSLIVALMLITVGLNTARRSSERAQIADAAASPATPSPTFARAEPEPSTTPEPDVDLRPAEEAPAVDQIDDIAVPSDPEPAQARTTEILTTETPAEIASENTPEPETEPETVAASTPDADPEAGTSLDALLGVIEDAKEALPDDAVVDAATDPSARPGDGAPSVDPMIEAALANASNDAPADAGPVGPAYSVRPDGSIEIDDAGVVGGDGSPQRPFVIDWQVLRSVARDYNPKQGQDQLPEWVTLLDGKVVRVEGNTLLPVVAAAVDELLVMQNPWDGCCIGVPPTPYDAIEVKLAELTRMGNAATGYGMVEGTFKVDPYIVQGWLLGLYVIEDASFESAAGVDLPGL